MKRSFTIFTILFFTAFFSAVVLKLDCEPAETEKVCSCKLMGQFNLAIEKIKEICKKNPNGKFCKLLENMDMLNTNIDANGVICIGKQLEKDEEIKEAAKKITEKLNQKPELMNQCFAQKDPSSFPKFEKLLRKTTRNGIGFGFLWGKKDTYLAAAFVAATKCLECHGKW